MTANSAEHLAAAREHTIGSRRRTRAHVIITHDLNAKSKTLYELFQLARYHPLAVDDLARELAADIIKDCDMLIAELEAIKDFALRQAGEPPPTET